MKLSVVIGGLAGAALSLSAGGAAAAAEAARSASSTWVRSAITAGATSTTSGVKAIEKAFGDKVETTFVESVPEADSERAIEQLARTGHKLIFTTSFGFMEPTLQGGQEVSRT